MQATFLVTLSLPDDGSALALTDVADEIHDDLDLSFDVISVAPWARPTLVPLGTGPTTLPAQQTKPTQPQ